MEEAEKKSLWEIIEKYDSEEHSAFCNSISNVIKNDYTVSDLEYILAYENKVVEPEDWNKITEALSEEINEYSNQKKENILGDSPITDDGTPLQNNLKETFPLENSVTPEKDLYITGQFSASISTNIIHDKNPEFILREINFISRKRILQAEFANEMPKIENANLYLKNTLIDNVEIYPKENQENPLDISRRMVIVEMLLLHPQISGEQDIDGTIHGNIAGTVFCKVKSIEKHKRELEEKIKKENLGNQSLIITDSSEENIPPVSNQTNIDDLNLKEEIASTLVERKGCNPLAKMRGCLSILLAMLLLFLLFFLMRKCLSGEDDNPKKERNQKERIEKLRNNEGNSNKNQTKEKSKKTLKTIKNFQTVSLPNVQFYTNSSNLLPSSEKELNELGVYLLENLSLNAIILGHTDNVGDDAKNLILSQKRAESVKSFLVNIGVDENRIEAVGKGETEPRASNTDLEGRLMNRRVEVELNGKRL